MSLVLSTRNRHKLREFSRLLDPAGISLEPLPDDLELPPEDGETFAENALGKARAAGRETGRVAIADDSGIEASALAGAPGVRSARYAGEGASDEENLSKLIREAPAGFQPLVARAIRVIRNRLRTLIPALNSGAIGTTTTTPWRRANPRNLK